MPYVTREIENSDRTDNSAPPESIRALISEQLDQDDSDNEFDAELGDEELVMENRRGDR